MFVCLPSSSSLCTLAMSHFFFSSQVAFGPTQVDMVQSCSHGLTLHRFSGQPSAHSGPTEVFLSWVGPGRLSGHRVPPHGPSHFVLPTSHCHSVPHMISSCDHGQSMLLSEQGHGWIPGYGTRVEGGPQDTEPPLLCSEWQVFAQGHRASMSLAYDQWKSHIT